MDRYPEATLCTTYGRDMTSCEFLTLVPLGSTTRPTCIFHPPARHTSTDYAQNYGLDLSKLLPGVSYQSWDEHLFMLT